ncbi:GGDEF domain-containing protein [Ideonella sp.]|uniref:GGDEF domain-containing protein n=1 Tax=Ideonella sp. TaxID=1929293 RepID=UPI0035B45EA4
MSNPIEAGLSSPPTLTPPVPRTGSLGRRLVIATLAFGIVFTLAAAALRTWQAWQANLASMTAELTLIDQVFQRTLSKAIWEMDRDALRTQLDSAAQVASVGRIELRVQQAGRAPEVLESHREGQTVSPMTPVITRELTYEPYAGASEVVGQLTLVGDERVLRDRLRGEVLDIVLTQLVQSLLLAGLIMWLFNSSVTVHVRYIARHLSELTPGTLGHALRLNRQARQGDELTLLEAGVNDLQHKLSTYLERQKQDERDLAAHRDRLAELVDEQTTELRAANKRLEEQSRADPLTGLANRRHFDELKDIEFRRAQRLGQPLTVLMCDVDFFKRYNDAYGHAQGDRCLQLLAEALRDNFARAGEVVARIGGEEFAVLLPGIDAAQARTAAERLRRRVAAMAIAHRDSAVGAHVTLSIGLAQFDPATMDHFDLLLHQADQALYRAKSQGRDQIAD